LNYKKLELFKIKKITEFINYELIFLKIINIYLIFYIFLLESALPRILLAPVIKIELINSNIKYKMENILNYK
jgi:hypothetical protein